MERVWTFKASFRAWALKSPIYVVDEPDAFNLNILKQSKVKAMRQAMAWAFHLSLILRMCP